MRVVVFSQLRLPNSTTTQEIAGKTKIRSDISLTNGFAIGFDSEGAKHMCFGRVYDRGNGQSSHTSYGCFYIYLRPTK